MIGKLAGALIILWSILGFGLYLWTIYLAYLTSFVSLVISIFFPVGAQLYWIFVVWGVTGVFFNPYTLACLLWLAIAVTVAVVSSRANAKL